MECRHVPCVAGIDVLVVGEAGEDGAPGRQRAEAQHHQRGGLEAGSIRAEHDRHGVEHQQRRDRADRRIGQQAVSRVAKKGPVHQVLEESSREAE